MSSRPAGLICIDRALFFGRWRTVLAASVKLRFRNSTFNLPACEPGLPTEGKTMAWRVAERANVLDFFFALFAMIAIAAAGLLVADLTRLSVFLADIL